MFWKSKKPWQNEIDVIKRSLEELYFEIEWAKRLKRYNLELIGIDIDKVDIMGVSKKIYLSGSAMTENEFRSYIKGRFDALPKPCPEKSPEEK